MKILFVSPQFDAMQELSEFLAGYGVVCLHAEATEDALQVLEIHSGTIECCVVQREGRTDSAMGLTFIATLRGDVRYAALPVIGLSAVLPAGELNTLTQAPYLAHAALGMPVDRKLLVAAIEAATGKGMAERRSEVPSSDRVVEIKESTIANSSLSVMDLQAAEHVQPVMEEVESSIRLEGFEPERLKPDSASVETGVIEMKVDPIAASEPAPGAVAEPLLEPTPQPISFSIATPEHTPVTASESGGEYTPDREAREQIPYVFNQAMEEPQVPVGDAVVPGGAASSPDIETLKKYLLLREQDVAALSKQLRAAIENGESVEELLSMERAKSVELTHVVGEQRKKLKEFEAQLMEQRQISETDVEELRFQLKTRADKVGTLERRVRESEEEVERIKERVRSDIRKIRTRERDLESRVEILKKDSEVLVAARENKIIDLKRKLDISEFNLELMREKYQRECEAHRKLLDRLTRATKAMKIAEGFLDEEAEDTRAATPKPATTHRQAS